jgi:hypothetical protein
MPPADDAPSSKDGEVISCRPEGRALPVDNRDQLRNALELRRELGSGDIAPASHRLPAPFRVAASLELALDDGHAAADGLAERLRQLEGGVLGQPRLTFSAPASIFLGVPERPTSISEALEALHICLTPLDEAARNELVRRCKRAAETLRVAPPPRDVDLSSLPSMYATCDEATADLEYLSRLYERVASLRPVLEVARSNIDAVTAALNASETSTDIVARLSEQVGHLELSAATNDESIDRAFRKLEQRLEAVTAHESRLGLATR